MRRKALNPHRLPWEVTVMPSPEQIKASSNVNMLSRELEVDFKAIGSSEWECLLLGRRSWCRRVFRAEGC